MLVDSGADATSIDKRTLRKIPGKFIHKRTPTNYKIRGVTGQSMATCGEIQIKSQIGKGSYIIKFVVVKNLGKSGILGSDFLTDVGAQLDFSNKVLTIGKNSTLLVPKGEAHNYSLVQVAKRVVIPPKSKQIVMV